VSDRREFLAAIGTAVALAGCAGGGGTVTGGDHDRSASSETVQATADPVERPSGSWTQAGADAGNTYVADTVGPTTEPTGERLRPAGCYLTLADPVVADGVLFELGPCEGPATPVPSDLLGPAPPWLIARDATTGEQLWHASVDVIEGGLAVADGTVVVVEDRPLEPRLRAFDASTGTEQWTVEFSDGGPLRPPTVAGGAVFTVVGGDPPTLRAVGLDGTRRWSREIGTEFTDVVVSDGLLVAAEDRGSVFDHDPAPHTVVTGRSLDDGAEQWRWEYDAGSPTRFAAADGAAYLFFEEGSLKSISTRDGHERWSADYVHNAVKGLAVTGDTVCVSDVGVLCGLDPDDGSERWTAGEPGNPGVDGEWNPGAFLSIAAGEEAVYGDLTGTPSDLLAVDHETGEERWRHQLPVETLNDGDEYSGFWRGPIVADGAVYGVTKQSLYRYTDSA
jgi:outer membrane protein assembly factor BamB